MKVETWIKNSVQLGNLEKTWGKGAMVGQTGGGKRAATLGKGKRREKNL